MTIQWYPGHMHKAQKEMRKVLPTVDVVIEILDARIPFSSENPMLREIRDDKPCIKVLNKYDLADADVVAHWQEYFRQQKNTQTIALSAKEKRSLTAIVDLCKKLLPDRVNSVKKIRAMVAGIPNVGKSTVINGLAGRAIAKTGNEPAVTKMQQSINLDDDVVLIDTPGILWPKQQYVKSSYRLAVTGAVKDTALEYTEVAFFAAEFFRQHYPCRLRERYGIDVPDSDLSLLESIGRQRGCLESGGRVNLNKVSEIFVHDIRSASLGGVCLETPEMIERETLKR